MKRSSIAIMLAVFILNACNNANTAQDKQILSNTVKELVFDRGDKIDSPNFTGDAWLNNLIMPDDENQNAVGSVTFAPGARTSWHSHPAGQIILALDGVGYYQEKGKSVEIIRKGEVVKCPHNIPHWHGASPDSEFIQVAITRRENGPTACYHCKNNDGLCAIKDDVPEIIDKIIVANVVVFSTPVYFYCMNAQLKTIIDRSVMKWTKIKNKDFYLIATAAEDDDHVMNGTIKSFQGFLECLTDVREAGYILGKGVYNKGEITGKPIVEEAYKVGKNI